MALPSDVLQKIKAAYQKGEAEIPNLQAEVARIQRAGLDATSLNTRLVALQQQMQKIKVTYPEALQ